MDAKPTPKYEKYDDEYVPGPFGMQNTGAICWFNSLLQVLFGTPALTKVLLENELEFADNPFARTYIAALDIAMSVASPCAATLGLSDKILTQFLAQIKSRGLKLSMGRGQESVDEAITTMIELFDNEKVSSLFANAYEITIRCTTCKKAVSEIRDSAYKINLFTRARLETPEKFIGYLRFHPTEVEQFKCDSCGIVMKNFNREEKLKMLKEIVMIEFDKYHVKTNRWYPETMSFPAVDGGKIEYKLTGIIKHVGNLHSGHYWAESFRNGKWYHLNDASCSPGSSSPSEEAVILVYHMM